MVCLLYITLNQFVHSMTDLLIIMILFILVAALYFEEKIRKRYNGLKYSEELFNTIGSNNEIVFWIYNAQLKYFEYASPNFEKTLELNKNILAHGSQKILAYFPNSIKEKIVEMYLSSGNIKMVEEAFEYIKPFSRSKCWLMLRIYPIFKDKSVKRLICVAIDIGKEKQVQLALEEALVSVKEANQTKKEFLSHITHELKTPISSIIGLATAASNSMDDTKKIKYYLNTIEYASRQSLNMINNILDMTKRDSNKLILENRSFCMSKGIEIFSAMMKEHSAINDQEYLLQLNSISHDYLFGDDYKLMQILGNCVSNSIKYTPSGGKIKLEVNEIGKKEDQALFQFVITDNGKGMSSEFLNHLFKPFEREDSTRYWKYGSTGIGMTITKEILDLMGGTIRVKSEINLGTMITIQIAFQINPDSNESMDLDAKLTEFNQYDCQGKRILVVEDNEINRTVLKEMFCQINLDVTTASDGYEAVKLFEASEKGYYDVILMDVWMPELDGYQASDFIRSSKHPDAKTVCIISLTADDFIDEQVALKHGVNYHIPKPLNMDEFYSIIMNYKTVNKLI